MTATVLVNIDVDDLERAVAFYAAAFGLTAGRRFGALAVELTGGTVAHLPPGEARRQSGKRGNRRAPALCPALDAGPSRFRRRRPGRAVARAQAAGATLEGDPATHVWGRIAQLADPFGHGLCLIQFLGRGYDEIATG